MREKRPYETKNIRTLIRVLYGIGSIVAILAGLGIAASGFSESAYIGKQANITKMIVGLAITLLSPFILQVLYRLTLAPFDIIDLIREKKI